MTDDTTYDEDVDAEIAPSEGRLSVLGQLKQRREEIFEGEHLDLPVPSWDDPEIIIRYKPIDHGQIRATQTMVEKAGKQKRAQAEINGNCDLLIRACTAVIARIDGQDYSLRPGEPKGDPTRFDADLARNLGLEENATARDTVKALFMTDGDILSHGNSVIEFSGYRETEADEQLEGE